MVRTRLAIFLLAVAFVGCSHSPTCPNPTAPIGPLTISGHLKFNYPITLPPDAQLICYAPDASGGSNYVVGNAIWNDTMWIFGTGTIDQSNNSFTITLTKAPNTISTITQTISNQCRALTMRGFGYVLLSPIAHYNTPDSSPVIVYGAVNHAAVFYSARSYTPTNWLGAFSQGLAIGEEFDTINGSDSLRPISNSGLELLIDTARSSFQLPRNWQSQDILN